ncbi:hypothetical protein L6164_012103 [Bauhinia variegata]|uniref:Uncharacterized protein n=1 Tax=Bauhinia variegata TaxID=167791 RepID=A0ACB9P8X9_BAUVA|nr:hypothetical protein L6164_012103 [Bauhinia variegata]
MSRSRIMSMKDRLSQITKGSRLVREFLQEIHSLADELSIVGHSQEDLDLLVYALNGLGSEFKEITTALKARDLSTCHI